MPENQLSVIGGAHTGRDDCVAAAVGAAGRLLGTASFSATGAGYGELWEWLRGWGGPQRVGVDGGCGAGLARHLAAGGVATVEVIRPNRRARRRGKSDPADAEAAAPAVLSAGASARR